MRAAGDTPDWGHRLAADMAQLAKGGTANAFPTVSIAKLPKARPAGMVRFCPDTALGPRMIFSTGAVWLHLDGSTVT